MNRPFAVSLALLVLSTSGCALLTKSDPLTARYFSPEPSIASADPPAPLHADVAPEAERELRLGRVTSASYLGERLVFRNSSYELGFYDDRRWTEKPEVYLRRALSRAFFEQRGIRHVISGAAPTLEVELVEFGEWTTPAHSARVRADYILYDGRTVRSEGTVTVDLPIPAAPADKQTTETVEVLAEGLLRVVNRIVDEVTAHLDPPLSGAKANLEQ